MARETSTLIVLISMYTEPACKPARMPSSPLHISCNAAVFVTILKDHLGLFRYLARRGRPLQANIQQLERELGLLLLERTSRSVRLTSAGEVFLR